MRIPILFGWLIVASLLSSPAPAADDPWHAEVPIRVLDPGHPLLKVFGGKGFTVVDEIYQCRNDTAQPTERR